MVHFSQLIFPPPIIVISQGSSFRRNFQNLFEVFLDIEQVISYCLFYRLQSKFTFDKDLSFTILTGIISLLFKVSDEFRLCNEAVARRRCLPPEVVARLVPSLFELVCKRFRLLAVPCLEPNLTTPDKGRPVLVTGLTSGDTPLEVPILYRDVPGRGALEILLSSRRSSPNPSSSTSKWSI